MAKKRAREDEKVSLEETKSFCSWSVWRGDVLDEMIVKEQSSYMLDVMVPDLNEAPIGVLVSMAPPCYRESHSEALIALREHLSCSNI